MNKGNISPADLVRAMHHGPSIDGAQAMAEAAVSLGFRPIESAAKPKTIDSQIDSSELPETGITTAPAQTPDQRPPLTFYTVRTLANFEQQPVATADPNAQKPELVEPELAKGKGAIAYQELVPWRQIRTFLQNYLSELKLSQKPDIPKLEQQLSQAQAIIRVPVKRQAIWADQCQFWLDMSDRLIPIRHDARLLLGHIGWERGYQGLEYGEIQGSLTELRLLNQSGWAKGDFNPAAKLIIASDLGIYSANRLVTQQWLQQGRRFAAAGCKPLVLVPADPSLWPNALNRYYQLVYWDRHTSFRGSAAVVGNSAQAVDNTSDSGAQEKSAQTLLAMAAGSVRLEFNLLRAIRMLDSRLSITEEMQATLDDSVHWTYSGLHFKHPDTAHKNAKTLNPQLLKQAQALAYREHQYRGISHHVLMEEQAKAGSLNGVNTELEKTLAYYLNLTSKIEAGGLSPREAEAHRDWIISVLGRLPKQTVQKNKATVAAITQAFKKTYEDKQKNLPGGLNLSDISAGENNQQDLVLEQIGKDLFITDTPSGLHLKSLKCGESLRVNQQLKNLKQLPLKLPTIGNTPLEIETANRRLSIKPLQQPTWATGLIRTDFSLYVEVSPDNLPPGQSDNELPYPQWADNVGWDDYGIYADVFVETPNPETKIGQRFRYLPPGEFLMGSPEDEPERRDDETQHRVKLTFGFWLGETAVTQELWQAITGKNPSSFKGEPNLPVESVSWEDCQEFLQQLNQQYPNWRCSLPTEAQWEYACRAGTQTPFAFGGSIDSSQVNFNGNYPYAGSKASEFRNKTLPVNALAPNAWGLIQMHGNVREWSNGWYQSNLDTKAVADPFGPDQGEYRSVRGGSWIDNARDCRSASRYGGLPGLRFNGALGLRLARVHT